MSTIRVLIACSLLPSVAHAIVPGSPTGFIEASTFDGEPITRSLATSIAAAEGASFYDFSQCSERGAFMWPNDCLNIYVGDPSDLTHVELTTQSCTNLNMDLCFGGYKVSYMSHTTVWAGDSDGAAEGVKELFVGHYNDANTSIQRLRPVGRIDFEFETATWGEEYVLAYYDAAGELVDYEAAMLIYSGFSSCSETASTMQSTYVVATGVASGAMSTLAELACNASINFGPASVSGNSEDCEDFWEERAESDLKANYETSGELYQEMVDWCEGEDEDEEDCPSTKVSEIVYEGTCYEVTEECSERADGDCTCEIVEDGVQYCD